MSARVRSIGLPRRIELSEMNPSTEDFASLFEASMATELPLEGSVLRGQIVAFEKDLAVVDVGLKTCLLYTSPSPRDKRQSRMPSSA